MKECAAIWILEVFHQRLVATDTQSFLAISLDCIKYTFYLEKQSTKLQIGSKIIKFEASNFKKCIPHSFFTVVSLTT
jgi:hypothetical protein